MKHLLFTSHSARHSNNTVFFRHQASSDKKQLDVGANLFIGNLDENVDERLLYDTFSAFGMMATTAKVCGSHRLMFIPF